MGSNVEAPQRNYGQETRETLQAQIDLSPDLLKAEQDARPGYTALNLQTMNDTLHGVGGQKGLLDIYSETVPYVSKLERQAASDQRSADIADVEKLGPKALAAMRLANPGQWALLDELNKGSLADLQNGTHMDPAQAREIQQAVRQGQAARGMGMGPADLYTEAMTMGQAGQQLLERRRALASGLVGLNQQVAGDQFMQVLGRPATAINTATNWSGQGQGMASSIGPKLFNPESSYAGSLYGQNASLKYDASKQNAANDTALIGGAMSMVGNMAGGFI